MAEPKYTIYELLMMLVERTGWQSEQIKLDLMDVVREAEKYNAIGVIGKMMACKHENIEYRLEANGSYMRQTVVCTGCGREIT